MKLYKSDAPPAWEIDQEEIDTEEVESPLAQQEPEESWPQTIARNIGAGLTKAAAATFGDPFAHPELDSGASEEGMLRTAEGVLPEKYLEPKNIYEEDIQDIISKAPMAAPFAAAAPLATAATMLGGKAAKHLGRAGYGLVTGQELPETIAKGVELGGDLLTGGYFLGKDLVQMANKVKDVLKFWKSPEDFYNFARLTWEQKNPLKNIHNELQSSFRNIFEESPMASGQAGLDRSRKAQEAFSGADAALEFEKVGKDLVESGQEVAAGLKSSALQKIKTDLAGEFVPTNIGEETVKELQDFAKSGATTVLDEKKAASALAKKLQDKLKKTEGKLSVAEAVEWLEDANRLQGSVRENSVLNQVLGKVRRNFKSGLQKYGAENPEVAHILEELQSGKDIFRSGYITEGQDVGLLTNKQIKELEALKAGNPEYVGAIDNILDGNKLQALQRRLPKRGPASLEVEKQFQELANKHEPAKKIWDKYLASQERAALSAAEQDALRLNKLSSADKQRAIHHQQKIKYKRLVAEKKEREGIMKILDRNPETFTEKDILDLQAFGSNNPQYKKQIDESVQAANALRGFRKLVPNKAARPESKTGFQALKRGLSDVGEFVGAPWIQEQQWHDLTKGLTPEAQALLNEYLSKHRTLGQVQKGGILKPLAKKGKELASEGRELWNTLGKS